MIRRRCDKARSPSRQIAYPPACAQRRIFIRHAPPARSVARCPERRSRLGVRLAGMAPSRRGEAEFSRGDACHRLVALCVSSCDSVGYALPARAVVRSPSGCQRTVVAKGLEPNSDQAGAAYHQVCYHLALGGGEPGRCHGRSAPSESVDGCPCSSLTTRLPDCDERRPDRDNCVHRGGAANVERGLSSVRTNPRSLCAHVVGSLRALISGRRVNGADGAEEHDHDTARHSRPEAHVRGTCIPLHEVPSQRGPSSVRVP